MHGFIGARISVIYSRGGVVIIIGVSVGEPGQQIVSSNLFIPCKLPEKNVLICIEWDIAIYTILMMGVGAKGKHDVFFKWQLVIAENFPSLSINTFSI